MKYFTKSVKTNTFEKQKVVESWDFGFESAKFFSEEILVNNKWL